MTPTLTQVLEDLRSGAVRLVPGEATAEMKTVAIGPDDRALFGSRGIAADAMGARYRQMVEAASPDLTAALVEMIEGLIPYREELLKIAAGLDEGDDPFAAWESIEAIKARALAAEAERDALREALAPMAAVASDIPDEWDDNHQCITACGHFRRAARALTKEQNDVGE